VHLVGFIIRICKTWKDIMFQKRETGKSHNLEASVNY